MRKDLQGVERLSSGLSNVLYFFGVHLLVNFIDTVSIQFLGCFLVYYLVFGILGLREGLLSHLQNILIDIPVSI